MLKFLEFENLAIEKQLTLEKELLKKQQGSFCLINHNLLSPTIVLGISNRRENYVDLKKLQSWPLTILRRFSGGGAVVIDKDTILITFIIEKKILDFSYPEQIFQWSENFYKQVFDLPYFHLKDKDYVLKDQKCGGTAQYLTKDKWLHHSSFLFDFEKNYMDYLLFPPQVPTYRKDRCHTDFLAKIKDHIPDKTFFLQKFKHQLAKEFNLIDRLIDLF